MASYGLGGQLAALLAARQPAQPAANPLPQPATLDPSRLRRDRFAFPSQAAMAQPMEPPPEPPHLQHEDLQEMARQGMMPFPGQDAEEPQNVPLPAQYAAQQRAMYAQGPLAQRYSQMAQAGPGPTPHGF